MEAGIHNVKGATIYTTLFPCMWCTKILISAVILLFIIEYLKSCL